MVAVSIGGALLCLDILRSIRQKDWRGMLEPIAITIVFLISFFVLTDKPRVGLAGSNPHALSAAISILAAYQSALIAKVLMHFIFPPSKTE